MIFDVEEASVDGERASAVAVEVMANADDTPVLFQDSSSYS